MYYQDIVAKDAYRRIMEAANDAAAPTPQAAATPNSGTASPTAPLANEVNPPSESDEITDQKYISDTDSEKFKDFKKEIVDDILKKSQLGIDMKNVVLSILKQTTGNDDDVRDAKDNILGKLMDEKNALEGLIVQIQGDEKN